jgi:hypothetical protein
LEGRVAGSVGGQYHGLFAVVVAIILPAKRNLVVFDVEQTVVGDGNAMSIACHVFEKRVLVVEGLVRCTELLAGGRVAVVAMIRPPSRRLIVVDVEQAVVGNGRAVRIACHGLENRFGVVESLVRCTELWFDIDPPFNLARGSEVAQEGPSRPQRLQGGEELQIARVEGLFEIFEE